MNTLVVLMSVALALMGGVCGEKEVALTSQLYEALADETDVSKSLSEAFALDKDKANQENLKQQSVSDFGINDDSKLNLGIEHSFSDFNEHYEDHGVQHSENEDISIQRNKEFAKKDTLHKKDGTNIITNIYLDKENDYDLVDSRKDGLEAESKAASQESVAKKLGLDEELRDSYRTLLSDNLGFQLFEKPEVNSIGRLGLRGRSSVGRSSVGSGGLFGSFDGGYSRLLRNF